MIEVFLLGIALGLATLEGRGEIMTSGKEVLESAASSMRGVEIELFMVVELGIGLLFWFGRGELGRPFELEALVM